MLFKIAVHPGAPLQDYYAHRHGGKPPLYYPGGEFYYYQGYLPSNMQHAMHPTQIPLSCINSTLAGDHWLMRILRISAM